MTYLNTLHKNEKGMLLPTVLVLLVVVFALLMLFIPNEYLKSFNRPDDDTESSEQVVKYPPLSEKNFKVDPSLNIKYDKKAITHRLPVFTDRFYYLKNGDVYRVLLKNNSVKENNLFFDFDNDITSYDISKDNNLLSFSTKDIEGISSVYLMDLTSDNISKLTEINTKKDGAIGSILFSKDSSRLVFTNSKIYLYDLKNAQLTSMLERDLARDFCPRYYINSFSPNSDLVYVRMGCYEGVEHNIVNLNDKEVLLSSSHYGGGDSILGIVGNKEVAMWTGYFSPISSDRNFVYEKVNIYTGSKEEINIMDEMNPSLFVKNYNGGFYMSSLFPYNPRDLYYYDSLKNEFTYSEEDIFVVVYDTRNIEGTKKLTDLYYGKNNTEGTENMTLIAEDLPEQNAWFRSTLVDVN